MHKDYTELEKQQRTHKDLESKKFSLQKSFLEDRQEILSSREILQKSIKDIIEKTSDLKDQMENVQIKKGKIETDLHEIKHKNQKLNDDLDNLKFESQKQISTYNDEI